MQLLVKQKRNSNWNSVKKGGKAMSENESLIERNHDQSLIHVGSPAGEKGESLADWNLDEYQQKLQESAMKAKECINEKLNQANEKFKEISNKDPKELIEDAKEFVKKNPGQAVLISAAVGLILGVLLRGRR
jgi:ElaB/YqjD/DUF883 family membrane-anchored ribosome-binding protein